MDKLFKHAPQIIEAAAKSPLGIFALMVLAISVLGFSFFHDSSELTRAGIFVLLLVGVAAFGFAAVRSASGGAASARETPPPLSNPQGASSTTTPVSLRRKPTTVSSDQVKLSLAKHGLYEKRWNPAGQGVGNAYQTRVLDDAVVVVDAATGLMWQKGGSQQMPFDKAHHYVGQLNAQRLAGFNDWRLPTVEEALSLMQPQAHNDFHIDPVFERGINFIFTSDHVGDERVWVLYFYDGIVTSEPEGFNAWARAVRCQ